MKSRKYKIIFYDCRVYLAWHVTEHHGTIFKLNVIFVFKTPVKIRKCNFIKVLIIEKGVDL